MCGRHPFATGLFALLGIAGLYLSIQGYIVDRSESNQNSRTLTSISDSLTKVNELIIQSDPGLKDGSVEVPIEFNIPIKQYSDNYVFKASQINLNEEMTATEAELLLENIIDSKEYSTSHPNYFFSVESIANKKFVQIAPYLLLDVFNVEKINEQLAAFYFGGRGSGAVLREFGATLFPQEGIQVAPLYSSISKGHEDNIDYISLEPGEIEEFKLGLSFLPGYYYDYRIGIQFKFNGANSIFWHTEEFHGGMPIDKIPMSGHDGKFAIDYHPDTERMIEDMKLIVDFIKKDYEAYARSRLFNLKMVDIDGPVIFDE